MGFSLMSLVGFENYVLYLILDFDLPQSSSHAMPIGSKSGNLAFVTTWLKGIRHTDSPNSFSESGNWFRDLCHPLFSWYPKTVSDDQSTVYQNKWHYYFACLSCVIWNAWHTVHEKWATPQHAWTRQLQRIRAAVTACATRAWKLNIDRAIHPATDHPSNW